MYVKATNGVIDQYPYTVGDLRRDNPNTSFPKNVPDSIMADFNMYPVGYEPSPPYDPATQYVETSNEPSLIDGQWMLTKTVVNMTPEQIKAREDRLKGDNKKNAEQLLQATDWVELPSVSNPANTPHLENVNEFLAYRTAVRAIAVNPPTEPAEFPVKPNEVWG
jgi:hypothetical protein